MKIVAFGLILVSLVGCSSSGPSGGTVAKTGESGKVVDDELASALDKYAKAATFEGESEVTITVSGAKPFVVKRTIKCKAPNQLAMVVAPFTRDDGAHSSQSYFVSDGSRWLEGMDVAALDGVAPHAICDAADSFLLSQSWPHMTYALRLFAGSRRPDAMWKSPPLEAGVDTIDGRAVKLYKFTGPGFFGTTELALDPKTNEALRIRAKLEPLVQALQSRKKVDSIQFEEKLTGQKFDAPIPDSSFENVFKPKRIDPEQTPDGWLRPGDVVPDFAFKTATGQGVKLSSLRGKTVFLDFWATWCGPCKMTLPDTQKTYLAHQNDAKFALFAISNEKPDLVKSFVKENSYTFPVGIDDQGLGALRLGVTAFPTFVVIDAEGKLVGKVEGANPGGVREILARAGVKS